MKANESSADYCRRMGWGPGTRLTGFQEFQDKDGNVVYGNPETITITAVGRRDILAQADGRFVESIWDLSRRDWEPSKTKEEE